MTNIRRQYGMVTGATERSYILSTSWRQKDRERGGREGDLAFCGLLKSQSPPPSHKSPPTRQT